MAEQPEHAIGAVNENVRQPRAAQVRRPRVEANPLAALFSRREYSQDSVVRSGPIVPVSQSNTVELHLPEENSEILSLISTCLAAIQSEEDAYQICAYYCTILASYYPGLVPTIQSAFAEIGVNVTAISTRLARQQMAVTMQAECTGDEGLVYLGQCVMVLFKTTNEAGYAEFMKQRTNAFRAQAGVPQNKPFVVALPYTKAHIVRTILGSSQPLKREVLLNMMASSRVMGRAAGICNYIVDLLAWHEMSSITFIYRALMLPRSEVLQDAFLIMEVKNFTEALKAIAASEYPPYFKILEPPHKTTIMERSRFPNLITIARDIESDNSPTVAHFAGASNVRPNNISRLLAIHKNYMRGRRIVTGNSIAFLYSADESLEMVTDEVREDNA